MLKRGLILAVSLLVVTVTVQAQSDESALNRATSALNDITTLIDEQEHNIVQLEAQLSNIEAEQKQVNDSITKHKWSLAQLRSQYAQVVRNINAHSSPIDRLAYIFSANSFKQAWQRANALRQLSLWRESKSKEITQSLAKLKARQDRMAKLSSIKKASLKACQTTRMALQSRLDDAASLVVTLKGKTQLNEVLRVKQQRASELSRELDRISLTANASPFGDTGQKLSDFKGKLPHPVTGRHTIVAHYGRQHHPSLEYISTYNYGIDIACHELPATAVAVAGGIVTGIYNQDATSSIVMVRHGEFLSVYAGLTQITVKKGQPVIQNQPLGEVHTARGTHKHVLHFELRHEQTPLNPEEYLR